jgi:hypothetical protein
MTVSSEPFKIPSSFFLQDLTFCYLHMTEAEIDSLEHLDDADYWDYAISDEGTSFIKPYKEEIT